MTLNNAFSVFLVAIADFLIMGFGKSKPKPFIAKVIHVYDGDSIKVNSNNRYYEIRLASIDAPEYSQEFGQFCKTKLSNLIENQMINIQPRTTDRYDRIVADILFGKMNINKEMVKIGCAWAYRKYLYDQSYIGLEKTAQKQKIGLWSQPKSLWIPPWKTRH